MKIPLPVVKKFSILKLFVWVIAVPCILVLITICDMKRESRLHKVTHEVFFDIEIDGKPEGRMVLGLFGEAVPMTVRNFYTFATTGYRGKMYENTNIHRVIKKFMIQGGDVVNGDGTGHLSIYGDTFPDENFEIHHSSAGFLSMANSGKDTNGCQFFITTLAVNYLDGKHVAFGKVVHGQGLVHKIEYLGTDWNDRPLKEVKIVKSGSQPLSSPYWISDDPYNLRDWLKTISFPLGLSFTIVFIFNYFIKKLDVCIDAADEVEKKEKVLRKIVKMKEDEKASMKGEEDKQIKEAPKVRKRNPKAINEK